LPDVVKTLILLGFCELRYSTPIFNRPDITTLLEMAKKGEVSCVIVKDFSRFGRDYIDVGDYLEQIFPFLGIRFISVTDSYDSMTHGTLADDVGNGFKNIYNSYYSKDLSLKVKAGLLSRKQSGNYTPPHCPYGYKKPLTSSHSDGEGIRMEIDEEAGALVRRIFELKAGGLGSAKIADILNTERIPSPLTHIKANGGKMYGSAKSDSPLWSPERIQRIARDIRYTGMFAYNMYVSNRLGDKCSNKLPLDSWVTGPGAIPAIVTMELFAMAQLRKSGNRADNPGGKGKIPLARKLVCGGCGYSLARDHKKNTCHCNRKIYTNDEKCLSGSVNMNVVEKTVESLISNLYALCEMRQKAKTVNRESDGTELLRAIRDGELRVRISLDSKNELYNRYCDGGLTREEYLLLRDSEDGILRQAEIELAELKERQASLSEEADGKLHDDILSRPFNGTLTREISDALIKRVLVHAADRIEVEWMFANPFENAAVFE
jgi:DNA invertase Pin-like site-specific DNA recombinase